METDSLHDTTVSVVDGGTIEAQSNDHGRLAERSSTREMVREIRSDVVRLGLDLSWCSEKLVNMNLLMMHVAAKESDFESFIVENEDDLSNSAKAALQFDILSGYFDLEVKEMDNFIGKLQIKFKNAFDVVSAHKHLGTGLLQLEEKLWDAEKSLNQSQEQVSELMAQSAMFQRIVSSTQKGETSDEDKDAVIEEKGGFYNTSANLQMQTSEQQRHILEMLEKSLARELDLENQLSECLQTLDKMKRKLHYSQREVISAEEETAAVYARFLEADNASAVLMGISKELMGQLQSCQLNINSSLCRESDLSTKLQNCMQVIQKLEKKEAVSQELAEQNGLEALVWKEKTNSLEEQLKASLNDGDKQHEIKALEEKVVIAESMAEMAKAESKLLSINNKELNEEIDLLKRSGVTREEIDSLEAQLRETDFQLQQAMVSVEAGQEKQTMFCSSIEDMEIVIEKLKTNVSAAESRAETAETEVMLLTEANAELKNDLELKKELENQATASVEASQEKQVMLYSSINKMETLIEKLKSNIMKADARADSAEEKCIILSESHAELNDEMNFLRDKVRCLEASLQQAEETKLAAAKDINIRTKVITDVVVQLALERERLHKQISWLMEDNKARKGKSQTASKPSYDSMNREVEETENGILSSEHHVRSSDNGGGDSNIPGTTEVHEFAEDVSNGELNTESEELKSKVETVRTIDAGQLNFRYVLSASLVIFIAVLATCFLSPENCPF